LDCTTVLSRLCKVIHKQLTSTGRHNPRKRTAYLLQELTNKYTVVFHGLFKIFKVTVSFSHDWLMVKVPKEVTSYFWRWNE